MRYRTLARKPFGNSMIEVLVAIVIMSLGALGVAGLQVTSKKANQEARQRLIASFLVNDIIEKMRNNPAALATYAGANVGGGTISSEPSPNCTTGNPCTATEMAAHDRWAWEQAIDGATVKVGTANAGGLTTPTGCVTNVNGQIQAVIAWYGQEETSDAGTGANGAAACGTAGSHRRQVVVNTFIN